MLLLTALQCWRVRPQLWTLEEVPADPEAAENLALVSRAADALQKLAATRAHKLDTQWWR